MSFVNNRNLFLIYIHRQPPKTIAASPELQVYVKHFRAFKDSFGLAAEIGCKIVGAVWVRIMNDYGHIEEKTPS